jgi:hypothetical protein
VLTTVEVVEPSVVVRTPSLLPDIHIVVPSLLTTLRMLPVLKALVSAVVVLMLPAASTRPMTRLIAAEVEPVMAAVPSAAS